MPDDQQYFAVGTSEPVAPRPFWRTWKLGALIGGLAVLAACAVFVVNAVQLGRGGASADVRERLEAALLACTQERDPAACEARVRSGVAEDVGDASACDAAAGSGYASCVTLAAQSSGDTKTCASLDGEEKTRCEDMAHNTAAESSLRVAECAEIADADLGTACRANVQRKAVAQGKCAEAGLDVALCSAADAYHAAVAQGTLEACEALESEEYRYICTLAIEDVDQDGDGLSVAQEQRYGTSDTDPDSDNDGYDDGVEVANGFNPAE